MSEIVYDVVIKMKYRLPADLAAREEMYGATDPFVCLQVDMETDAAFTMAELLDGVEVLSVEEESDSDAD